ncbi:MAG TPA: twin-arginine translocase TatA/TatE family subunit [Chloroflexota bacterium]
MPSIGPMELVFIAVVVLMVFGPGKLPELGGSLGKMIREFRRAAAEEADDEERRAGRQPRGPEATARS